MASSGVASYNDSVKRPPSKKSMPTQFVQGYRKLLAAAMATKEPATGKTLGQCAGIYGFYDYDGEPIYVGQTWENLGTRIGRHLRGQRTDTLAYRILDPFEVAEVAVWPAEDLRIQFAARRAAIPEGNKALVKELNTEKRIALDALEYSVYLDAIEKSKYGAILNEKIPPKSTPVPLPTSYRFNVVPEALRDDREHPDVRIARRAETLARVAAVAHERGEVSVGLRRVIVIQAVRLADLAAARLAYAEGRSRPAADAIDVHKLVGNVMAEFGDQDEDEDS